MTTDDGDPDVPHGIKQDLAFTAAEMIIAADGPDNQPLRDVLGRRLTIGDFRRMAFTLITLRDAIRDLHAQVNLTDPNDPVGVALTKAGLERCP